MTVGEAKLSYTLKVADNGTLGGNNLFTVRGDTFEDFKTNLGAAFGDDFAAVFNVNLKEAGEQVATGAIKGALDATPVAAPVVPAAAPAPATGGTVVPPTAKQVEWLNKLAPGQYDPATISKEQASAILDDLFAKNKK